MRFLITASTWLNRALLVIGGVLLTFMMVLACANIVLRSLDRPVMGVYELLGLAGALVTAFALGATQQGKGHIALTILADTFPPTLNRAIDALSTAIGCAFFALVGWRTLAWARSLAEYGELTESLHLTYWPFPAAVALGCLALTLQLLVDLVRIVRPDFWEGKA